MNNVRLLLLVLLIIAAVFMVARFWDVLMLFLLSAIIAYVLSPLAGFLQKKLHIRRAFAVFLVLAVFLAGIFVLVSLTLPRAAVQVTSLLGEIRRYTRNFTGFVENRMNELSELGLPQPVIDTLSELLSQSDRYISGFLTGILAAIVNVSLRLFDGVIVIILVVYYMLDGRKLLSSLIAHLPGSLGERAESVLERANRVSWAYIRSKVIISGGMSVVTYVGLSIIGVDYAFLFAVMTFVLDFIPYFGSIIAGVVEAFYALITLGAGQAAAVGIFVLVVQQIEGNIVVPKVQGDLAGLHPITVIFAILASNELWGPAGMLISVPIAAALKIILTEVYAYVAGLQPAEAGEEK